MKIREALPRCALKFTTKASSTYLRRDYFSSAVMPTYYSRLTTVQLAVADLRKTTTSKPKTRPHPSVYEEINACATEFAKASVNGTLDENPIHTEDEKHSHVRYLGTSGNMPFFIVQAGKAFFEPETEGKRTRRPARVPHSAMNTASMSQISSLIEPYVITRKCKAEGAYEPVQGEDGKHAPFYLAFSFGA